MMEGQATQPIPTTLVNPDHADVRVHHFEPTDSALRVAIEGRVNYESTGWLESVLLEQYHRFTPENFVLDLAGVTFMDSQGLSLLLSLHRICEPRGCQLALRSPNPHIQSMISLTRIDQFVKVL